MSQSSQFSLLVERRFAPFFATQFLGAFNDNVFRNGLVILITFQGTRIAGMNESQLANVAGALFILPFFLFSSTAGQLADKYEKSRLFRAVKLLEVCLMLLAGLALMTEQYVLLLGVLFLMGCQSTMFGPVKYAYLPQRLATHELIGGNALVESGTYLAIILGLLVGGIAAGVDEASRSVLAACLVAVALAGYLSSRQIPDTRPVDPGLTVNWNVWSQTLRIVGYARENHSVFLSILGISWFWFYGSALTLQVPAYTLVILNGTEEITTVLLVAFAVGVGIGALLCERMSRGRIELGLVPFGAIGLTVFGLDLYFAEPVANPQSVSSVAGFLGRPGSWRVLADLALLGAFGGFFSVPLYALVQKRSERKHLSRIIAANNVINAFFMVCASLLALALLGSGLSIPQLFIVLAAMNAAVALYLFALLPEFLMRFLAWILTNLLYRIRIRGEEHIPEAGPAVLVCNHVSYVDALALAAAVRRPMRFVMYYRIFEIPVLRVIFRGAKAIPIASAREDEALLERCFEQIAAALEDGQLVCLFPEGAITRDGEVQRFRPGIERIVERTPVPVIPVALSGLWGSWFSRQTGGGLRKLPGRLFCRVDVRVGAPVQPAAASAEHLEILVRTLRGERR